MGLGSWFRRWMDGTTIAGCQMDLKRVTKLCQAIEYRNQFASNFIAAIKDFRAEEMSSPTLPRIDIEGLRAGAMKMKQTAKAISFGSEVVEEALSMTGNWLMLAALQHHTDPTIREDATRLLDQYFNFARGLLPAPSHQS